MSYASDTLLHYIKTLWEQTDLQWNSDNQAEVESIIESLETTIERQVKQELQREERRQKISSEQLAALILTPQDLWDENTLFGDSKTVKNAVKTAVKLADLLIEELAETSSK